MPNKAKYQIQNGDDAPFVYAVKSGSRIQETLEALRKGPVPAPAFTRRSDHVFRMRSEGLRIETEFRPQSDESHERYGVYTLLSRVSRIPDGPISGPYKAGGDA